MQTEAGKQIYILMEESANGRCIATMYWTDDEQLAKEWEDSTIYRSTELLPKLKEI